jgi:hypothetical protein
MPVRRRCCLGAGGCGAKALLRTLGLKPYCERGVGLKPNYELLG